MERHAAPDADAQGGYLAITHPDPDHALATIGMEPIVR